MKITHEVGGRTFVEFTEKEMKKTFTPRELATGKVPVEKLERLLKKSGLQNDYMFMLDNPSSAEHSLFSLRDARQKLAGVKARIEEKRKAGIEPFMISREDAAAFLQCTIYEIKRFEKSGVFTTLKGDPVMYPAEEVFSLRDAEVDVDEKTLDLLRQGKLKNATGSLRPKDQPQPPG
jgi:hypothetical protein